MLYGCYIQQDDHAQYALFDWWVFKRDNWCGVFLFVFSPRCSWMRIFWAFVLLVFFVVVVVVLGFFALNLLHTNTYALYYIFDLDFLYFDNCIVPVGFLLWEIRVAFPGDRQLRQSRTTQPTVHAGCFSVFIVHRTLTWTTGSLTCVQM